MPATIGGSAEPDRLAQATGRAEDDLFTANPWYEWGPYLSERAWGTVPEDYSGDGNAWESFPHEQAGPARTGGTRTAWPSRPIATVVAFLASDSPSCINGTSLFVDGDLMQSSPRAVGTAPTVPGSLPM